MVRVPRKAGGGLPGHYNLPGTPIASDAKTCRLPASTLET